MTKITFLSLILFSFVSFGKDLKNHYELIRYELIPFVNSANPYIKVDMQIKGEFNDKVIIELPDNWAGVSYKDQIKNVQVIPSPIPIATSSHFGICRAHLDKLGSARPPAHASSVQLEMRNGITPSQQTSYAYDKVKNQIAIENPQQYMINISYELHPKADDYGNVHEVLIRKNLIHTPGYGIFAFPEDLKDAVKVKITWKNIPAKWQTISSHGAGKEIYANNNKFEILGAIFVAGDIRLKQVSDPAHPIYISLYGKFNFKDQKIIEDLKKMIQYQRNFFSDQDFPFYLISLIEGTEPHNYGGTRLHNSFTAFFPKNVSRLDYYILSAHEHFNNWIGGKIAQPVTEELSKWWSEGFTDYYSRVLALRSGSISLQEFINEFNRFLSDYYLSEVINAPNIRIAKDFWNDDRIEKLPYYRGFVFAIYLNYLIKNHTNGKFDLDHVLLDLFAKAKEADFLFSETEFGKIVKSYIPKGIDKEMQDYIVNGDTIDLENVLAVLPLHKIKISTFCLGFDDNLEDTRTIKNINPKSNAFKAGLREGDQVKSWDFHRTPDKVAIIGTNKGIFKFEPKDYHENKIWQLKTKLSSEEKNQIKIFFGL